MYKKNQFDRDGKCLKSGNDAVVKFKRIAKKTGLQFRDSSFNDDVNKHIDIWVDNKSYDIKSAKKRNRSDKQKDYDSIWIELHGVRPNDGGWLYDGNADFIAFETRGGFIIFDRLKLLKYVDGVQKKIRLKDGVHSSSTSKKLNRIYSRRDRPDEIICFALEELKENVEYEERRE